MADQKEMNFEQALDRLEEIVKSLESGDLPLETALRLFEEGMRLSARCSHLLDTAEKTIQLVTADKDGNLVVSEVKPGSN